MSSKMQIEILSSACCNPPAAVYDRQYEAKIKEVLAKAKIDAQVEVITFSAALYSPKAKYLRKAQPLIDKYGIDALPALFINCELLLFGGVPSTEKLTEAIQKATQDPSKTPEKQRV
jgi:protein-disulfide isomerase